MGNGAYRTGLMGGNMGLMQIFVGVFTAAFLIFLKIAHSKAHKQKIVATRLRSYLLHWQSAILEYDLFNILYLGIQWNKAIQKIVKDGGGPEELVALEEEQKKEIAKIKDHIISNSGEFESNKATLIESLKKLPENPIEYIFEASSKTEQNLIDGKTFITDEEASQLGIFAAQIAVNLKMNLISLIGLTVGMLTQAYSDPEKFDFQETADDIAKMVWKGVLVSKDIDTLLKQSEIFSGKSIFELTMQNLRDEF